MLAKFSAPVLGREDGAPGPLGLFGVAETVRGVAKSDADDVGGGNGWVSWRWVVGIEAPVQRKLIPQAGAGRRGRR